ncbi:MAG: STAS domain-containing protein [Ruminococcus sp.]|nr:STAS domain-containing protein [Ruminococcus sp.]
MKINKEQNGQTLTVTVDGRIDTLTSPKLEAELKSSLEGITELIFDFTKVDYVSSAGLRVLLNAQKTMDTKGEMVITGCSEDLIDVFEITGFADILTIK